MNFYDNILKCPICGSRLEVVGKEFHCENRHCFDRGSSGYVNFGFVLGHRAQSGDPPDAVRSRSVFLDGGYYLPAAKKLASLVTEYSPKGLVVDAGCGEGYYSVMFADDSHCVFGADLSKYAVDRASKRARSCGKSERTLFSVASVFEIPLFDDSADAVVCMFSPCSEAEYSRILKPGGVLVVGSAGKHHLYGLKRSVYDTPTLNEPRADLPAGMKLLHSEELNYEMNIPEDKKEDIVRLFGMTPYRYRTSQSDIDRLSALESLTTELDFEYRVYQKIN